MAVEAKSLDLKAGKAGKAVSLSEEIFGLPLRTDLLNEYVLMQRRNKRQGTHSTKTRSEVAGTGKKPFRQKGTGHARQGSLKGPHQEAGGVAFGPKPRSYASRLNKTTRRKAVCTALSQKRYDGTIFVAESFEVASGKTKDALKQLEFFAEKSLLIVGNFTEETKRSVRNVHRIKLLEPQHLNVFDLLKYQNLLMTQEALDWVSKEMNPSKAREAA